MSFRKLFGSIWIIPACEGPALRAIVTITAGAHPDAIRADGEIFLPGYYSSGFTFWSIDDAKGRWIIDEPEAAAIFAAEQTGAIVTAVPRLVTLPGSVAPQAFWMVRLDRAVPVSTETDSRPVLDSVVYVGGVDAGPRVVPVGATLYSGITDRNRLPPARRRGMAPVPPSLQRDASQAIGVLRIVRANGALVATIR